MSILPFRQKPKRSNLSESDVESLFCYLDEQGCFTLSVVARVDRCIVHDWGVTTVMQDGYTWLGGYEVQASVAVCFPSHDLNVMEIYYHTESPSQYENARQLLNAGNCLLIKGDLMDLQQPVTLCVRDLANVSLLPESLRSLCSDWIG